MHGDSYPKHHQWEYFCTRLSVQTYCRWFSSEASMQWVLVISFWLMIDRQRDTQKGHTQVKLSLHPSKLIFYSKIILSFHFIRFYHLPWNGRLWVTFLYILINANLVMLMYVMLMIFYGRLKVKVKVFLRKFHTKNFYSKS